MAVYVGQPYPLVGTKENTLLHTVSVFPNPATDHFYIRAHTSLQNTPYVLFDLWGKVQKYGKLAVGETRVELGHLAKGIYVLCVGEQVKGRWKLVKQ